MINCVVHLIIVLIFFSHFFKFEEPWKSYHFAVTLDSAEHFVDWFLLALSDRCQILFTDGD